MQLQPAAGKNVLDFAMYLRNFKAKNKFRMVKMQKMFSKYPDVVSIKELTVMLNISKNTAYELLKSGELKSIKIGKQYRIPKRFVIEYLSGG